MTALHKAESLLEKVRAIRPTPQNPERQFNLFRIIRSGHEEVSVHSRFLYELLNPQGAHGQGDVFLTIFVKRFVPPDLKLERVEVFRERDRIDISLRDVSTGSVVIIENKIYAGDQAQQLKRYYEKLDKRFKHVHILYLTLQGDAPGVDSLDGLDSDAWRAVSYLEIIEWLNDCLKLVQHSQTLYANIRQYKFLLEDLTGGPMDDAEREDLHRLLDQDDHYDLALRLERALQTYREATLERFWSKLMVDQVRDNLGDGWTVKMEPASTAWRKFRVEKDSWLDKATVCYEFGKARGFGQPGIGILVTNPTAVEETAEAYEKLGDTAPQLYPTIHREWRAGKKGWLGYQRLGFTFADPTQVAKCRPPDHELLSELSRRIVGLAKGMDAFIEERIAWLYNIS